MSSELDRLIRHQSEFDRVLARLRYTLIPLNPFPPGVLDALTQMDRLRDQFGLPTSFLTAMEASQKALGVAPTFEKLTLLGSLNSTVFETLRGQQSQLDAAVKLASRSISGLPESLQSLFDSLASTEALLRLNCLDTKSIDAALQPHLAFQEFAKAQLNIDRMASLIQKQHRSEIVDVSARLLDPMTKGMSLAALMRPPSELLWEGSAPDINAFRTLSGELATLELEDPRLDVEAEVAATQTGSIVEIGSRMIQHVYDCNSTRERTGADPVFKPTTKTLRACSIIPTMVVSDEQSFMEIVNQLYFLLYEGSGSASRLLEISTEEELSWLWTLKHLRLDAAHDIAHGAPSDVKKKHQDIGNAYVRLVGSTVPRNNEEWTKAQAALYRGLSDMLGDVWLRTNK